METETSVTAMAEEMKRQHNLPGDSDEDDMGDDELEELFGRDAIPGRGTDAEDPIDLEGEGGGAEANDVDDLYPFRLPLMYGMISRSSSKWDPKVRK